MAHTILLIDYDPRSIESIRELLRVFETRLILARDGKTGLEEYRRSRPDLTLIQDLIPVMHGFDVCRQIKRSEDGADHPVVLLCRPRGHANLVDTGCDAYLKKPYDGEALLKVLDGLLPGGLASPGSETSSTDSDLIESEIDDRIDDVLGALGNLAEHGPEAVQRELAVARPGPR